MNITTAAELDALPVGSVVIDAFAAACVKARQTEPSMPSDWVRVTTAVKGGEHHHRPFVPGIVVRHGLDDPDQQPTAQPAYRYPVTDDTGKVIAYDLHPPEHYHQPPTADYLRKRANDCDLIEHVGTFLNYVGGRPVGVDAEADREKVARRIIRAVSADARAEVQPTVEEVAKTLLVSVASDMAAYLTMPQVIAAMESAARAVLALLPGRTEAEVKAEALRDAAVLFDADFCGVSLTLRARADQIEVGA